MAKIMKNQNQSKQIAYYDPESDVFYIGVKKGLEEEYEEIAPGINAELNEKGEVIGIEILNASRILKPVSKAVAERKAFQYAFA